MKSIRFLVLLALLGPGFALARSTGITNQSGAGCSGNACHGTTGATPTTRVCISGLPADGTYVPGTNYPLTVFVDGFGVPPMGVLDGGAVAGFNLAATAGTLAKDPDDDSLRFPTAGESTDPNQLTHTYLGSSQNHWSLFWEAPASGSATLRLAGNAVNGNGTNDANDLWNKTAMTLTPGLGTGIGTGIICGPPLPLPQVLPIPGILPAH